MQEFAADYVTCAARCAAVKACTKWVYAVESKYCILRTGETRQLKGSRAGLIAGSQHCPREAESSEEVQQQQTCYDYHFKYPTSQSIKVQLLRRMKEAKHVVSKPGPCSALREGGTSFCSSTSCFAFSCIRDCMKHFSECRCAVLQLCTYSDKLSSTMQRGE